MDKETDVEKQLRNMEALPVSEDAKKRTRDVAWVKLRNQRSFSVPNMPRVASFLLIAGALFSVLSYSVTQSTRSGSQDSGREQSLISSAQISQYPAGIRTSLVRMIIGGLKAEDLRFNRPDEFDALDSSTIGVFHPDGGGAPYQFAPADIMDDSEQGEWVFTAEIALSRIGSGQSDIVAFLEGVSRKVCERINEELGIEGMPKLKSDQSAFYRKRMIDDGVNDYVVSDKNVPILDSEGLTSQPFGCFLSYDGKKYVYYHALIER